MKKRLKNFKFSVIIISPLSYLFHFCPKKSIVNSFHLNSVLPDLNAYSSVVKTDNYCIYTPT